MTKRKQQKTPTQIYQLKITLNHSRPPIWRRVQVAANVRLSQLHNIIQAAMDWENYHLHQFIVGKRPDWTFYGVPAPEYDDWGPPMKDESLTKLNQILKSVKDKFVYEYDFGDGWEHIILLEKILQPEDGAIYPRCVKGKRACPPEDCGGIWGYANLLEAMADPEHPEHEDLLDWMGGDDFDPEYFDLDEINARLRRI